MPQSRDLVLIALGSDGAAPRWFGPPLESGVHLRWTFVPELGFPANGFTLFRRTHRPGTLVTLEAAPGARELTFGDLARRVEVRFTRPGVIPAAGRLPRIVALYGGVPVANAQATLQASHVVARVAGDAIDTVRIVAPLVWRVQRVRYVPAAQDEDAGWQRLMTMGPAPDWANAAAPIPPEVAGYYIGSAAAPAPRWQNLRALVDDMIQPLIPKSTILAGVDDASPTAQAAAAELLLLASIDPYVARLVGLYAVDASAAAGQSYDYKVVGNWIKTQIASPEIEVTFEASFAGRRFAHTFLHDAAIFRCANRAAVEPLEDAPWRDTRRMLDLEPFTLPTAPGTAPYLRIQLAEPAAEVQLYLCVLAGTPDVLVPDGQPTLTRWSSPDGRFAIVSLAARSASEPIEAVALHPANTGSLHVGLAKVGLRRTWLAPFGEPRSWIAYDVARAAADPLAAPQGLTAAPLRTPARELPNGGVAAGARAALKWDLPIDGGVLAPDQAVLYLLQRQSLGSGAGAAPIDPASWDPIRRTDNPALPVTVGTSGDSSSYIYVDDPAVAAGKLQPDRFYAYRVAAIDLFGRVGPFGPHAIADLTDAEPPPPPADLEAKYLDPRDPLLAPEERAWVDAEPSPRSGIRVRWSWPAAHHTQAPDAREFRVYIKHGALNTIAGRITALVAANPDGSFALATNGDLPGAAADVLAGEPLRTGDASFVVLDNTAGADFSLVVRPPDAPPPLMPAPGSFSISLRAPRPLEGVVVSAHSHLSGLVTLKTDQTTDLPPNALAGKTLRQGGRDHQIVASTNGALQLVVRGIGLPPRRPAKGRFAVVEPGSPGSTTAPVVAHSGNPLWTDYRHAARWDERVTVVPITAADRYETIVPYELHVSADVPIAAASIGVTAADDKAYVGDDPRWNGTPLGGRSGNEGAVSAPVIVQRTIRQPPARPAAPEVGDGLASAADFYGGSYVDLQWARPAGMRVEIFRAMDETLVAVDRKARSARPSDRGEYLYLSDEEFALLVAGEPDYASLSDDLLTALARLPDNQAAFGLLTPEPLDAERYRTAFPGRSANRHLFAVRLVDPAGNRSALGWPSRAVHAPQALLPRAPVVTKILGGDRAVTLRWASNREADLREYRIYRTTDERDADDVRLMTLVHTELVTEADPAARPPDVEWRDTDVTGSAPVWYRVAAIDAHGNRSSSAAVATRAFAVTLPSPVALHSAEWVDRPNGPALRAEWTPIAGVEIRLQRRPENGARWLAVSQWIGGAVGVAEDFSAEPYLVQELRLEARDGFGMLSAPGPAIEVPANVG